MVRRLITLDLCDDCTRHGMTEVPAVTQHVLAVNGGPLRRVQLCGRCQIFWQPFITLYEEYGQDETPPAQAPAKKKARAVRAPKPKELEAPAPAAPPEPPQPTQTTPKQYLLCPLPHGPNGAPKRIEYTSRGGHADMVHGLRLWEIEWEDPDRILKFTCPSHAECVKKGVGFTTKKGVGQHVRSCPLPHIDQENSEAAMRQEGDPQKPDEPAP